MMVDLTGAKIIQLPKIYDARGNLSFIEEEKNIPFKIRRTHWIYDVPGGEFRAGYAYKDPEEFLVAISGSFDVILDDGRHKNVYNLSRSYYGLYIPKMIWRSIGNFSTNSLCLLLTSEEFNLNYYINDYELFRQTINESVL